MPFLVKQFFTINYIPLIIISNTSHMQNPSEIITEIKSDFLYVPVLARTWRLFYTPHVIAGAGMGIRGRGSKRAVSVWFGSLSWGLPFLSRTVCTTIHSTTQTGNYRTVLDTANGNLGKFKSSILKSK